MPKNKVPRFKIIHCRHSSHPGKVIARFDRSKYPGYSVPASEILAKIRSHYKKHHPRTFKKQIKKALKTKRERGIINKHRKRKTKKRKRKKK